MKTMYSIFLSLFIAVSAGAYSFAQPAPDISHANNRFAFDVYTHLSSSLGNVFFSPYSLSSALTMTYEGARHKTADEMRMALCLPSDEVDWRTDFSGFIKNMEAPYQSYELSVANALWVQNDFPFKEDYLSLVKNTYFAEARNLDFITNPEISRLTINNWVSGKTHEHIIDLLPPGSINAKVRLVLTNAIYFKGKWSLPFNKKTTKQDVFWLSPIESVQTAMMGLTGKSFRYAQNDQVQIVELPYQGNDLSMIIVLPSLKDIQPLEKLISESMLSQWEQSMVNQPVNVYMPKFKFDASYQMSQILIKMGMVSAFDRAHADFSAMAHLMPNQRLYIDEVYHKAWIDVDEQGTEAAAATAVVMRMKAMAMMRPILPKIFRADHPFIFVIRDNKTSHILFMGRVSDPREK